MNSLRVTSIAALLCLVASVSDAASVVVPQPSMATPASVPTPMTTYQPIVEAQVMEVTTARPVVSNNQLSKTSTNEPPRPLAPGLVEVSHSQTVTKVPILSHTLSRETSTKPLSGERHIDVVEPNLLHHDVVTKVPMLMQQTTQSHIQIVKSVRPTPTTSSERPTTVVKILAVAATDAEDTTTTQATSEDSDTSTMSPDITTTTWLPTTGIDDRVIDIGTTNMPSEMTSTLSPESAGRDPCDIECTKFDFSPVCTTNGQCAHEFPNECIMRTHNCRHPMQQFKLEQSEQCHLQNWLPRCTAEDLSPSATINRNVDL